MLLAGSEFVIFDLLVEWILRAFGTAEEVMRWYESGHLGLLTMFVMWPVAAGFLLFVAGGLWFTADFGLERSARRLLLVFWSGIALVLSTPVVESVLYWYAPDDWLAAWFQSPHLVLPVGYAMLTTLVGFALVLLSVVGLTCRSFSVDSESFETSPRSGYEWSAAGESACDV